MQGNGKGQRTNPGKQNEPSIMRSDTTEIHDRLTQSLSNSHLRCDLDKQGDYSKVITTVVHLEHDWQYKFSSHSNPAGTWAAAFHPRGEAHHAPDPDHLTGLCDNYMFGSVLLNRCRQQLPRSTFRPEGIATVLRFSLAHPRNPCKATTRQRQQTSKDAHVI